VAGDTESAVLNGWRAELVGHDLQAVLAGEMMVKVTNGELKLVTSSRP